MQLQGKISELRTTATDAMFKLNASDGSETLVRVNKPLGAEYKNGDEVIVSGTNQTDPPFLADSVTSVSGSKPASHMLLYLAAAAVVLIIVGVVYFTTRSSGNVWTITAMDGGTGASNVPVSLLDFGKQPLKTTNTSADGTVSFQNLSAGTYFASGPQALPITATFTKNTHIAANLAVKSPNTWTVQTTTCGRGDANNQLNLVSAANVVLKSGVTDTTGRFSFTNLAAGSYKVLAPGNLVASATINGSTPPPDSTLAIPLPPPASCMVFRPYILHPLQLAPRSAVVAR